MDRRITGTLHRPQPAPRYVGFRGLHYVTEGGRPTAWVGAPAVIPAFTDGSVIMTSEIQQMSYEIMAHFCPTMSGERWRVMHGSYLAMTNRTGFGDPNAPHRDYLNELDLDAEEARYDKCRTFQGSFITGTLNGDKITCVPGADGIDALKPMPSLATILAKRWYSIAVNTGDPPHHFRPLWGGLIAYPFIMSRTMTFESKFFARWDEDFPPDPIATY